MCWQWYPAKRSSSGRSPACAPCWKTSAGDPMFAFAGIILLAASSSVDFVDEVYQIPPKHWNFIDLTPLKERPARVLVRYKSQPASNQVRIVMMGRADLDRLFKDERHQELAATPPAGSGTLAQDISRPGDYA